MDKQFRILRSEPRQEQDRVSRGQLVLPAMMILTGIVSVQFGAGLADKLFGQIPPAAVTGLRLWTSAVAMRWPCPGAASRAPCETSPNVEPSVMRLSPPRSAYLSG